MEEYKVVIPCAGAGGRLGGLTKHVNKALITVGLKPIISYIIEKFPENIEFVIALGYKGQLVKDFLELAYPERKFTFVDVDLYEGEGSSVGYSLFSCKKHLQCPFIFCANDTIVTEEIPCPVKDWIGYYALKKANDNYRSVSLDFNVVNYVHEKGENPNARPYIGLCGINSYKRFWRAMEDSDLSEGECIGLNAICQLHAYPFMWQDTGNLSDLDSARARIGQQKELTILPKEDEAIWFVNDKVIKFHIDKDFIKNRIERAKHLEGYVPTLLDARENMYSYKKVEGRMFSKSDSILSDFKILLKVLGGGFWKLCGLNPDEEKEFDKACIKFYKDKTYQRIEQYFSKYDYKDTEERINRTYTPKLFSMLDTLDWDNITDGFAVRFHGDLHFENIVINEETDLMDFYFMDWRQDFGGIVGRCGDIYYDFAKLLHGMIVSHELIADGKFNICKKNTMINFDFLRKQSLIDCENYFMEWILTKPQFDYYKVAVLTALIFLNIAPLHEHPYSEFLFYLGKSYLYKVTSEV